MIIKTFLHFMHFIFVLLPLLLLCLETKIATPLGHQPDATGVTSKCIDKERYALLEFKAGLEDPFSRLPTWRAEDDCCKWRGVSCNNQTGHVTKLDLNSKQGFGPLQGNEHEFRSINLGLLKSIDLSSNNLVGQIPDELTGLHELLALNLSRNALQGEIPRKIGKMKSLLALDLSKNNLSGAIPSSMSMMTLLDYLDLSDNSLTGRIPSSTQLQSFDTSRYIGNVGLCGPPITQNCPGDDAQEVPHAIFEGAGAVEGMDESWRWFYIGGGTGFATGFWIACGALLLNRRGRHAFCQFHDHMKDWIYLRTVMFHAKLRRVAATRT